ncbi:EF-hand domain-containing protein [Pseudocolwellia sp. AS88]|uniref:EF-hand domain-containing protein n=1 Tax=Pseudocolwellia TaxID=2848177 RepID=UPI0026F16F66|nr:EF-hand domain-containing protein [Pseudocolwellia sp. AS88]MDO7086536.1 EF-hand domain-containing protein [Pseudocolwellia sp. AS88]
MRFLPHKIIIATLLLTSIGQVYAKGDQERGERPQRPTFASIDTNEDGEISFDEFSQHEIPMGDHETIFAEMDSDGNDVIDEDEFDSHKPPRRR